jgi:hypothetical protein
VICVCPLGASLHSGAAAQNKRASPLNSVSAVYHVKYLHTHRRLGSRSLSFQKMSAAMRRYNQDDDPDFVHHFGGTDGRVSQCPSVNPTGLRGFGYISDLRETTLSKFKELVVSPGCSMKNLQGRELYMDYGAGSKSSWIAYCRGPNGWDGAESFQLIGWCENGGDHNCWELLLQGLHAQADALHLPVYAPQHLPDTVALTAKAKGKAAGPLSWMSSAPQSTSPAGVLAMWRSYGYSYFHTRAITQETEWVRREPQTPLLEVKGTTPDCPLCSSRVCRCCGQTTTGVVGWCYGCFNVTCGRCLNGKLCLDCIVHSTDFLVFLMGSRPFSSLREAGRMYNKYHSDVEDTPPTYVSGALDRSNPSTHTKCTGTEESSGLAERPGATLLNVGVEAKKDNAPRIITGPGTWMRSITTSLPPIQPILEHTRLSDLFDELPTVRETVITVPTNLSSPPASFPAKVWPITEVETVSPLSTPTIVIHDEVVCPSHTTATSTTNKLSLLSTEDAGGRPDETRQASPVKDPTPPPSPSSGATDRRDNEVVEDEDHGDGDADSNNDNDGEAAGETHAPINEDSEHKEEVLCTTPHTEDIKESKSESGVHIHSEANSGAETDAESEAESEAESVETINSIQTIDSTESIKSVESIESEDRSDSSDSEGHTTDDDSDVASAADSQTGSPVDKSTEEKEYKAVEIGVSLDSTLKPSSVEQKVNHPSAVDRLHYLRDVSAADRHSQTYLPENIDDLLNGSGSDDEDDEDDDDHHKVDSAVAITPVREIPLPLFTRPVQNSKYKASVRRPRY